MTRRHGSVNRTAYLALLAPEPITLPEDDDSPIAWDKPIREESETEPYYSGRTYTDAAVCEPRYTMVRRIA